MCDVVIVGSGLAGAVSARKLAEMQKKVLVLEKRDTIGGNAYDCLDENGVRIHVYGPHIFHTNHQGVYEFLCRFCNMVPYEHRVLGRIDSKLVPIPFNFQSLEMLLPEKADDLKQRLLTAFPNTPKISILTLLDHSDEELKELGEFIFEKVFVHYTAKQWGIPISEVDTSVINRVPVVLGYDDRYFQDTYQCMPENGYTELIREMLNHPNITVELNCDATKRLCVNESNQILFDGNIWEKPVVYTGAIDELFSYRYGSLPYRSLRFAFESFEQDYFQAASVVNYPNEEDFTRITEFKHFTGPRPEGSTTIVKEYPLMYDKTNPEADIPYYPIDQPENKKLYRRYLEDVECCSQLYLCGRLAEYRYYNMDAVVESALRLVEKIKKG